MLPNRDLTGKVRPVPLPRIASALLILAAAAAATEARATLWVSPSGDDGNPGTEEQPLRTIGRARDVVRTLNHDMGDDITVFIAGAHHLDRPLELGPEDSGTNGFNVVYTAAPGEHPVVSGGVRVAGWALVEPARNLWSAPEPAEFAGTLDLFVNGTPVSRTRGRLLAAFSRSTDARPAAAPDPGAHWKNPGDVVFLPQEDGAIWSERTGSQESFVVNAFELLGVPGEWYLDRAARRFYYTPRPGEDMAAADVEAASAPGLISGAGTRDRPVAGVIFKGIRFEYTARPGSVQAPREAPEAAVRFTYAGAIQFLEDEFVHLGTPALGLGPAVADCTVDGCAFADVAGRAATVSGASKVRIEESRFSYVATAHDHAPVIEVSQSTEVLIERCQFDHYPSVAILRVDGAGTAAPDASNVVSPPMIAFHGAVREVPSAAAPGESGVPQAYHAILDATFSAPTVPCAPAAVSAEAEDGFAYVTWIPSCIDGGSPVTSYTVASSTGAKATISSGDFLAKGYMAFAGLENGHAVAFTVAASSAHGSSPPSLATAEVTPAHKRKLRPPQAPAAVSFTTGGAGASVRITPPAADGGSPVIAYVVSASPEGPQAVIEGLDVIRADATQPVARILEGFSVKGASAVSISARNAAGLGKPLIVNIKK
jgi:hypothetical protein